ncbi:MAG: hypothetical protein U9O20_00020 [Patescibacteria group bacterium]|nr:hypothetical protein [Patescibacteria group bacterium]
MRNYSKVGGRKGMPGYRMPRYFLNRFMEMTKRFSKNEFYKNFKNKFGVKRHGTRWKMRREE